MGRLAGDGIGPEHFAAFVPAVTVETGGGVVGVLGHGHYLVDNVVVTSLLLIRGHKAGSVAGIERLAHVQAVEPHLPGIHLLVPEASVRCARLLLQLPEQRVHGQAVFLVAGLFPEIKQQTTGADMIQIEVGQLVGPDLALRPDHGIDKLLHIVPVATVAGAAVEIQQREQFDAGGVVPFVAALHVVQGSGIGVALQLALGHPY